MFEPLVGELFRSGFVMQAAALQGDFVTPTIMGAGESDTAREQRGARALFRMLADDAEHGARQPAHRCRAGWTSGSPVSLSAARSCSRSGRSSSEKVVRFDDSLRALARRAWPTCWKTSTLEIPEGDPRMTEFKSDRTSSNQAGVTLMNNQVGYVVAQVMRDKKDVDDRASCRR